MATNPKSVRQYRKADKAIDRAKNDKQLIAALDRQKAKVKATDRDYRRAIRRGHE